MSKYIENAYYIAYGYHYSPGFNDIEFNKPFYKFEDAYEEVKNNWNTCWCRIFTYHKGKWYEVYYNESFNTLSLKEKE